MQFIIAYLIPAGIYVFKANNRNTKTKCAICLKLTMQTLEQRHWPRCSGAIVNFKHNSQLIPVFQWLNLSR